MSANTTPLGYAWDGEIQTRVYDMSTDRKPPTSEPDDRRVIARKLAAVIGACQNVPETGWNDYHKYKYVTEADLIRAIRSELSAQGVCFIPSIVEHERTLNDDGKTINFRCLVEYTFVESECGQSLTVGPFWGEGEDKGDKAGYKALTGALKYCLRQTFLVATGDDPEAERRTKKKSNGAKSSNRGSASNGSGNTRDDWKQENRRFRALVKSHAKRAPLAMKAMASKQLDKEITSLTDVPAGTLARFNERLQAYEEADRPAQIEAWCIQFNIPANEGGDDEN